MDEVNHIPSMRACGLLDDIEICINRLVFNASTLIVNMDTNIAEQYNSIICKFVGGKRINFSLKRSYATRCKAAAISFNSAGGYYDVVKKHRLPFYTKRSEEKMKKRRGLQKLIKQKNKDLPKKCQKKYALPDKNYGPDAVPDPDLPIDQFEQRKDDFLNSLKKTFYLSQVEPCGLFIDEHDFIFGASPDGLIGDDAIVEVKCPKAASKMHPIKAIEEI